MCYLVYAKIEGLITGKIVYEILKSWDFAEDFQISRKVSRFHADFKILCKISGFHARFQDFMQDFQISARFPDSSADFDILADSEFQDDVIICCIHAD